MQNNHLLKAGALALFLLVAFVSTYELWLRQKGYSVSYDENESLWSDKRGRVYQSKDKAVVFLGSSRIKFDLDIPTFEQLTGREAVQLAMQGTNPLPALHDLADDEKFKGNLVMDVTEVLFFNTGAEPAEAAVKNVAYFKKYSPSQKVSFQINHLLESRLVMLDQEYFSLNGYLKRMHLKDRKDIYGGPEFPWEFDKTMFDRQSKMDDRFLKDTNLQNQVRAVWGQLAQRKGDPPPTGAALDSIFNLVKADVDKIRSRGGNVIFVRTPSTGPFWQGEQMGFPREKYWDKLIEKTQCAGIHFKDYPVTADMYCPEFSHLSPSDAVVYTKELIRVFREKGFLNNNSLACIDHFVKPTTCFSTPIHL